MAKNTYSRPIVNLGLLLAGLCFFASAGATVIYAYTAEDGSVSLSNIPVDHRYKLLLTDGEDHPGSPFRIERRKGFRSGADKARFDQVIEQTAQAYGLESALLHAVISVESGYNSAAVSSKGASGLMQLMPQTAIRYGVADRLDPIQSLHGGAKYLRDLLKLFNSDLNLVLAAYNAGESAVARHGNRIPPFRETTNYVIKAQAYYKQYGGSGQKQ